MAVGDDGTAENLRAKQREESEHVAAGQKRAGEDVSEPNSPSFRTRAAEVKGLGEQAAAAHRSSMRSCAPA